MTSIVVYQWTTSKFRWTGETWENSHKSGTYDSYKLTLSNAERCDFVVRNVA
jgi:hypothetical protein